MNPREMTNQQLADAMRAEGDFLLSIEAEVVRTSGRAASPMFAEKDALYKEIARRLRDSVPKDLYEKAWQECYRHRWPEDPGEADRKRFTPGQGCSMEAHDAARKEAGL